MKPVKRWRSIKEAVECAEARRFWRDIDRISGGAVTKLCKELAKKQKPARKRKTK